MDKACVIGLGDMGSGLALNLIKAGFATGGYDPDSARLDAFAAMGGEKAASAAEAAKGAKAAFVMVMNGAQMREVIFGSNPQEGRQEGLLSVMDKNSVIVMTATIKPNEAREIAQELNGRIQLVDSPVSGGRPGAEGGTLTLMAAGSAEALETARPFMEAIGGCIHQVGDQVGMGQTVKACLQSLIGSIFAGAFEACTLAAKAGVKGEILHQVFSTSGAGCGITNGAIENVMNRKFEKTGSHINTMHKDLTIALDMAMELGVPLFTASTAMQLFQAGRTRYPDGDNQAVARIGEEIVGTGLKR